MEDVDSLTGKNRSTVGEKPIFSVIVYVLTAMYLLLYTDILYTLLSDDLS